MGGCARGIRGARLAGFLGRASRLTPRSSPEACRRVYAGMSGCVLGVGGGGGFECGTVK